MVKLCANKSEISHLEQVQQRQFWSSAATNVGMSMVNMLPQMLAGGMSSIKSEESVDETMPVDESDGLNRKDELTPEQKADKVVNYIQTQRTGFNKNSKYINELVSKYDLYKKVHADWSDNQIAERLNLYLKALEWHDKELELGEKFEEYMDTAVSNEDFADKMNNCDVVIVDKDIENVVRNDDKENYANVIKNRGQAYIELYDNGTCDGKIDFDEFCALEAKDIGQTELTDEQKAKAREYFDIVNKNGSSGDEYIDADEMAAHYYAISRLFDNDNSTHTEAEITMKEFYNSTLIIESDKIKNAYTSRRNSYFGE
jgi:hypothetical protein